MKDDRTTEGREADHDEPDRVQMDEGAQPRLGQLETLPKRLHHRLAPPPQSGRLLARLDPRHPLILNDVKFKFKVGVSPTLNWTESNGGETPISSQRCPPSTTIPDPPSLINWPTKSQPLPILKIGSHSSNMATYSMIRADILKTQAPQRSSSVTGNNHQRYHHHPFSLSPIFSQPSSGLLTIYVPADTSDLTIPRVFVAREEIAISVSSSIIRIHYSVGRLSSAEINPIINDPESFKEDDEEFSAKSYISQVEATGLRCGSPRQSSCHRQSSRSGIHSSIRSCVNQPTTSSVEYAAAFSPPHLYVSQPTPQVFRFFLQLIEMMMMEIVRWCQERLHRLRSPGSGREPPAVRYLSRAEKRTSQHLLISPPDSPPPKYELLLDNHHPAGVAQEARITQIPTDWQTSLGPPNSVLRRNRASSCFFAFSAKDHPPQLVPYIGD
ncbi:hypothetical protein PGT21_021843 [Puccinia graminis f. sp. tritici]|uniref:Uncharacterized protein n=1 Tax=Puccinia graminis f. sp. tritici TaxID=56615 RepID=A0A5B0LXY2_PUCGR|nr:hypothetical protein PGT21_021843 [Puccinia graminis f. sp. tritici]